MTLAEQVNAAIKESMLARDPARSGALRLIKSELQKEEISKGKELTDLMAADVFRRMVKQRRDSAEQYRAGGRDELAAKEIAEIAVIEGFMPAPLPPEEISRIIDETMAGMEGADAGTTTGAIVGRVMAKLKATGRPFDGREANEMVLKRMKA